MRMGSKLFHLLIVIVFLNISVAKERQKRWFWYNGYAETILGFIFSVPFQTFLPGLGPEARSLEGISSTDNTFDFHIQPQYQDEVSRVLEIFAGLGLNNLSCQERLICLLSSTPEKFNPISEIILREIQEEYGPILKNEKSLIWKYQKAYRTGLVSTLNQCEESYPRCPVSTKRILNIPVLKLWQFMASRVNMRLL